MVLGSMNKFRKNLAFTLAEVLITLGIIGIVAAMVIPSLINAYQKHVTVTRLKQTYAQITQAVKLSEAENGDFTGWNMSVPSWSGYYPDLNEKFVKTYFLPYLKYTHLCQAKESYCNTNTPKYLNGNTLDLWDRKYGGIVLSNGVVLKFWIRNTFCEIYVDINGSSAPNILGKDIFIINLIRGHFEPINKDLPGVYLYGEGYTREQLLKNGYKNYLCAKEGRYAGLYCGALIKEDGWKISKDYPW